MKTIKLTSRFSEGGMQMNHIFEELKTQGLKPIKAFYKDHDEILFEVPNKEDEYLNLPFKPSEEMTVGDILEKFLPKAEVVETNGRAVKDIYVNDVLMMRVDSAFWNAKWEIYKENDGT